MLILLAAAAFAGAMILTLGQVEEGDSSCGALYQLSDWTGGGTYCEQLMTSRLIAVIALVLAAALAILLQIRRRASSGHSGPSHESIPPPPPAQRD